MHFPSQKTEEVEETLYCRNEHKCPQQTIDSINHVIASPIVVLICLITTKVIGSNPAQVRCTGYNKYHK
jgi:NAD-dependent DNA ligase